MVNKPKVIGTAAETAVSIYFNEQGFPVERRALQGSQDKGDIAGIPDTVVEVKAHKSMNLAGWIDETQVEKRNAGASLGVVFHKRRGKGNPAEWYVSMTGADFVNLLRRAQEKEA